MPYVHYKSEQRNLEKATFTRLPNKSLGTSDKNTFRSLNVLFIQTTNDYILGVLLNTLAALSETLCGTYRKVLPLRVIFSVTIDTK